MRIVHNCDASQLNKHVPNQSVACVVTSPPYNLNIENKPGLAEYEFDKQTWGAYDRMARDVSKRIYDVLVPGGRAWINVQPAVPYNVLNPKDKRRVNLSDLWGNALGAAGLRYRDTVVWIQDSFDGGCAWGSWGKPSAPNMRGGHEFILCVYKEHPDTDGWRRPIPPKWKGCKDDREGLGGDIVDLYRNVWKVNPARSEYKATFPLEIPARCIRLSAWPDETVLDPFVGTGTTLEAAEQLAQQWGASRKSIGIEKSKSMAKLAQETT
jgi:DNA modification methylase